MTHLKYMELKCLGIINGSSLAIWEVNIYRKYSIMSLDQLGGIFKEIEIFKRSFRIPPNSVS